MERIATGLMVMGWKIALALVVGSSALTTLFVFLLARFTHVFDAYAGERARMMAQFHNLDKLVKQTEKLTATTETIKAEIQHKVWETQSILTLKRDIYTRLLESIGQMIEDHQDSMDNERMHRTRVADAAMLDEYLTASNKRLEETMRKWNRAVDIAPILISDESYELLPQVFAGLLRVNFDGPQYQTEANQNIEHLKLCRHRLQQAARADLGMTKLTLDRPL
jgi:uncharacterized protein YoxC